MMPSPGETAFQNAPPYHIGGLMLLHLYLHNMKRVVLFSPSSGLDTLRKAKQYGVRS